MPSRIVFKKTQSQRARASVSADDVPSIFIDAPTTKVMAALGALGPLQVKAMKQLIGMKAVLAVHGLRQCEEAGIVYAWDVPFIWGVPRIYGLNRGHVHAYGLRQLCKSLWEHSVKQHVHEVPETPFVMPPDFRRDAAGGVPVWSRAEKGSVALRILAELDEEMPVGYLTELVDANEAFMGVTLGRFVSYGIVAERRSGRNRYVWLNPDYPGHSHLKRWLGWLNRNHDRAPLDIVSRYEDGKAEGDFDSKERLRRTHVRIGRHITASNKPFKKA